VFSAHSLAHEHAHLEDLTPEEIEARRRKAFGEGQLPKRVWGSAAVHSSGIRLGRIVGTALCNSLAECLLELQAPQLKVRWSQRMETYLYFPEGQPS